MQFIAIIGNMGIKNYRVDSFRYRVCVWFLSTGYIVGSGVRRANGVQGLRFLVQSEKCSFFVERRVESFIRQSQVSFRNVVTASFNTVVSRNLYCGEFLRSSITIAMELCAALDSLCQSHSQTPLPSFLLT